MNPSTTAEWGPAPSAPSPAVAVPPRRRRVWPWLLLLPLVALVLTAGLVALIVDHVSFPPVDLVIDGERVVSGWSLSSLPAAHLVVLVVSLALLMVLALVVVPVVVAFSVALVLALVLGAVALAFSPLLLAGWLLWTLLT